MHFIAIGKISWTGAARPRLPAGVVGVNLTFASFDSKNGDLQQLALQKWQIWVQKARRCPSRSSSVCHLNKWPVRNSQIVFNQHLTGKLTWHAGMRANRTNTFGKCFRPFVHFRALRKTNSSTQQQHRQFWLSSLHVWAMLLRNLAERETCGPAVDTLSSDESRADQSQSSACANAGELQFTNSGTQPEVALGTIFRQVARAGFVS